MLSRPSRKSKAFRYSDTEQRCFEGGNNNPEDELLFQEGTQTIIEAEGLDRELCRKEKSHREETSVENGEI